MAPAWHQVDLRLNEEELRRLDGICVTWQAPRNEVLRYFLRGGLGDANPRRPQTTELFGGLEGRNPSIRVPHKHTSPQDW
jgi:hypothetical protein